MTKMLLAPAIVLVLSAPVLAWFDKGHMVVARLAWKQLDKDQRARVTALLKNHPHYDEFLATNRRPGYSEEEWAFLRAATWSDWVTTHHAREFAHPTWHYVNYPFLPPTSHLEAAPLRPRAEDENVIGSLTKCIRELHGDSDRDKAIYLCWLLHLVGDIHQPLHCTALFSEEFPAGDHGGNLVLIRVRTLTSPVRLHAFWDGLPGSDTTAEAIESECTQIESLLKDANINIRPCAKENASFESWAKEGYEVAKKMVYLDGDLKVAPTGTKADSVPMAPADYASQAHRTARLQIAKAAIRLDRQLQKLFPPK